MDCAYSEYWQQEIRDDIKLKWQVYQQINDL
jgi:hypothetical protein